MSEATYISLLEKHLDQLREAKMGKPQKAEFHFDERSLVQIAWLVERRELVPEYLYVVDWFSFGWTSDSLKAIRFARREDAEQILKMIETEVAFATEHQWGMG